MKKAVNIIFASLLVILGACGTKSGAKTDKRPVVTVSIAPQAWILEAIAGDSIKINVLLNKGTNPETYEPTVNTIKDAVNSDVVMLSGSLGFEAVLADRIAGNNSNTIIVDTSQGIEPIYNTHTHSHGNHVHHEDTPDPHTWTSVANARIIAANMTETLKQVDTGNSDYYSHRAAMLDQHLDSLDKAIKHALDTITTRSFLVWHPSLSYFARDYGLEQIVLGNESRETSIQHTRRTIDRTIGSGAKILFVQADYDSNRAETLSNDTGARVFAINPLDADWEKQIKIITDALTQQ
ncbi:MAG: zinc ABC transporter substrate-binding protein [Clostridiales bacterium]|nr:zinc ABC transporter substrate-binding protein [Clostridiales bacterium]